MTNPLLDFSGLPRFDAITPDHVTPAIDALLEQARAAVAAARSVEPVTWESFVVPLDDATERLYRAWGQVSHLESVVNTPELREVYNANLAKITRFGSEVSQDLALYAQYRKLADSLNARIGVYRQQEAAMVGGSMFGWGTPAAQISSYDVRGNPIKPVKARAAKSKGMER